MNYYTRKWIKQRLDDWAQWLAKNQNAGWSSKSSLTKVMEYGVRTGTDINILPVYEIDRYNMATHRLLLDLETSYPDLYKLAWLEWAWHVVGEPGDGRKALKPEKISKLLKISRKKYHELKRELFSAMLGRFTKK